MIHTAPNRLDGQKKLGYLETIGRVTGKPREIEIWFALEGDRIYLLSGGGANKDWIKNFTQTPTVRFRVGDVWASGIARVVDRSETDLDTHIRKTVAAKYYGYDPDSDKPLPNDWSRTALPVVIDLDH